MPVDSFRLIVLDEAHHATAAGYSAILERFRGVHVLGVTATPDRLDGAALGDIFESVAYRYELRQAICDGWLVRIEAQRVRRAVDLDRVHGRAGDLDLGDLESLYGTEAAVRAVVDPLHDLASNLRTIVFAVSVAHAEALAVAINERESGTARALSGSTAADERQGTIGDFSAGRLRVLVNCSLFTEGFDCPAVECVAIARPTKSRALYTQMIGRGTRLAAGKDRVLVLDFVGNTKRHRPVTPAEILAGSDEHPDVVAAAAEQGGEVIGALDAARSAEERARRPATEGIRFWAEVADIFGALPGTEPQGDPASDAQRAALERAGLKVPDDLSRAAASALLDSLASRRQRGLATYRQVRLLARFGADAKQLSFDGAQAVIAGLIGGGRRSRRTR